MRVLFFLLSIVTLSFALPAHAENKVVQCGKPDVYEVRPDPGFEYCDIHGRRIAYQENSEALRKQMQERQQNFRAPAKEAVDNYNKAVEERDAKPDAGNE